jgi:predicted house-cleaning noncanonical NTP pyrophosphatase (MazG superfamily)
MSLDKKFEKKTQEYAEKRYLEMMEAINKTLLSFFDSMKYYDSYIGYTTRIDGIGRVFLDEIRKIKKEEIVKFFKDKKEEELLSSLQIIESMISQNNQ